MSKKHNHSHYLTERRYIAIQDRFRNLRARNFCVETRIPIIDVQAWQRSFTRSKVRRRIAREGFYGPDVAWCASKGATKGRFGSRTARGPKIWQEERGKGWYYATWKKKGDPFSVRGVIDPQIIATHSFVNQ